MDKFTDNYLLLEEMYEDPYYPKFLVDKLKFIILNLVSHLVEGNKNKEEVQQKFDEMVININNLQEDFYENDSELETVARDCIAMDIKYIIDYFSLDITLDEAFRERDW